MTVVDLSSAVKQGQKEKDPKMTLGLAVKGWVVAWATAREGQVVKCGLFRVPERLEQRKLPSSERAAMAFRALVEIALQESPVLVVQENQKAPAGPIWNLPPILAVTQRCGYTEVGDQWMEALGVDRKSLRSWATVALGSAPQDESVPRAMGIALMGSELLKRASHASPPPAT
jgi:hypothetical protein